MTPSYPHLQRRQQPIADHRPAADGDKRRHMIRSKRRAEMQTRKPRAQYHDARQDHQQACQAVTIRAPTVHMHTYIRQSTNTQAQRFIAWRRPLPPNTPRSSTSKISTHARQRLNASTSHACCCCSAALRSSSSQRGVTVAMLMTTTPTAAVAAVAAAPPLPPPPPPQMSCCMRRLP